MGNFITFAATVMAGAFVAAGKEKLELALKRHEGALKESQYWYTISRFVVLCPQCTRLNRKTPTHFVETREEQENTLWECKECGCVFQEYIWGSVVIRRGK